MNIYPARLRFFAASALCAFLLLGPTPSVQAKGADASKGATTLNRLGTKRPTKQSALKKSAASKPKAASKRHANKTAARGKR